VPFRLDAIRPGASLQAAFAFSFRCCNNLSTRTVSSYGAVVVWGGTADGTRGNQTGRAYEVDPLWSGVVKPAGLVLDLGLKSVCVIVFDAPGRKLVSASHPAQTTLRDAWIEHDAAEWLGRPIQIPLPCPAAWSTTL
jgi:hypothetical protein